MVNRGIGTLYRRTITTWVLIAGMLLQPILTYLATPHLAEDGEGHTVVLCTLNGLQEVYFGDLQMLGEQSDEEHCPALKLIQLAGTAQPAAAPQPPVATLYLVAIAPVTAERSFDTPHTTHYPIRAPPMV